jgi:hypothetical protein
LHSMRPEQLISQLSPSDIINIQAALLANQVAASSLNANQIMSALELPMNTYSPQLKFGINDGNILAAAIMHRDLQQQYLSNSNSLSAALPKSDSDASNGDKKPPARR